MEGLKVRKKVTPQPPQGTSSFLAIPILGFMALVALLLMPFLLLAWLLGTLWSKAIAKKWATKPKACSVVVHEIPNNFFSLRYQYVTGEDISAGAHAYFADEQLIIYQSDLESNFFSGYFSDFKVECPQGLFVQKINFNTTLTKVDSMPLYFFKYATKEADLRTQRLST